MCVKLTTVILNIPFNLGEVSVSASNNRFFLQREVLMSDFSGF